MLLMHTITAFYAVTEHPQASKQQLEASIGAATGDQSKQQQQQQQQQQR
jgi:hypothetical protein